MDLQPKIAASTAAMLLACWFGLPACTRYTTVATPEGAVVQRTSYPQYQAVRTKRQMALSLTDQERFRRYYQAYHSWPLSLEGFVAASDTNYRLVSGLRRQGFTNLEFVSRGPDSLRINFLFQTSGNLTLDRGVTLDGLGRGILGSFIFVADPVSGITFRQQLAKKAKD